MKTSDTRALNLQDCAMINWVKSAFRADWPELCKSCRNPQLRLPNQANYWLPLSKIWLLRNGFKKKAIAEGKPYKLPFKTCVKLYR